MVHSIHVHLHLCTYKNLNIRESYILTVCLLPDIFTSLTQDILNFGFLPYYNFHQLFHLFLQFFKGNLFLSLPPIKSIVVVTVKLFLSFFPSTSFLFGRCRFIVIIIIFAFFFGLKMEGNVKDSIHYLIRAAIWYLSLILLHIPIFRVLINYPNSFEPLSF